LNLEVERSRKTMVNLRCILNSPNSEAPNPTPAPAEA
jgi:hypothetical protein